MRKRQAEQDAAAAVPVELTSRARWARHAKKRPMRTDGLWASVTDPSTWSDYATARASSYGDGIGFVLAPGDRIVVVDLDHAVDDGKVAAWARRIVDGLPATYTEVSVSGTGLHLWFRGDVDRGRKFRRGDVAVELYGRDRFIVLGERVPGYPAVLAELQDAAAVVEALVPDAGSRG